MAQWQSPGGLSQRPWVRLPAAPPFFLWSLDSNGTDCLQFDDLYQSSSCGGVTLKWKVHGDSNLPCMSCWIIVKLEYVMSTYSSVFCGRESRLVHSAWSHQNVARCRDGESVNNCPYNASALGKQQLETKGTRHRHFLTRAMQLFAKIVFANGVLMRSEVRRICAYYGKRICILLIDRGLDHQEN